MKRFLAFFLIIVFLFSGCTRVYDINERLIIQGVGIDYISENEVEVTVQTLNTDTYSGIGGTKLPDKIVKNYTLRGKSVAVALSKLKNYSGKEPLYTHTRIVLADKKLAEKGLKNEIDFFSRDPFCRANLCVAVCDGRAGDYLKGNSESESIPSVEIENALGVSQFGSDSVNIHIYELIRMYREETTSAFLPVVSFTDKEKKKDIAVSGVAVFDSDRMVSSIDENDTFFLLMFLNRIRYGTYNLSSFDGEASFDLYKSKCRTEVNLDKSGNTAYFVKLKCVFDCVEFSDKNDAELDEIMIKKLENLLENELKEKMTAFLGKMCRNKTDCMRLGRILLHKNTLAYKEKADDWQNALSSASIIVDVNASIRRIGQESSKSAL